MTSTPISSGVPILAIAGLVLAVTPATAQDAMPLPDGDGMELVAEVCSGCHDTGKILAGRGQNAGEWRDIVLNMVSRGAQIFPEEVDTIVRYLAANFGPRDGAAAPKDTADTDDPDHQ